MRPQTKLLSPLLARGSARTMRGKVLFRSLDGKEIPFFFFFCWLAPLCDSAPHLHVRIDLMYAVPCRVRSHSTRLGDVRWCLGEDASVGCVFFFFIFLLHAALTCVVGVKSISAYWATREHRAARKGFRPGPQNLNAGAYKPPVLPTPSPFPAQWYRRRGGGSFGKKIDLSPPPPMPIRCETGKQCEASSVRRRQKIGESGVPGCSGGDVLFIELLLFFDILGCLKRV